MPMPNPGGSGTRVTFEQGCSVTEAGLSAATAERRLAQYGPIVRSEQRISPLR